MKLIPNDFGPILDKRSVVNQNIPRGASSGIDYLVHGNEATGLSKCSQFTQSGLYVEHFAFATSVGKQIGAPLRMQGHIPNAAVA